MTPPTDKPLSRTMTARAPLAEFSQPGASPAGKSAPGHRHGSRALPPPWPDSSRLHEDVSPGGQDAAAQALVLPGTFGVSLWVRRVILSPSHTRGSYLRPAIRSFIGISA